MENRNAFGFDTEKAYEKLSNQVARNRNESPEEQKKADIEAKKRAEQPRTRFNLKYAKEVTPHEKGHIDVRPINFNKQTLLEKFGVKLTYLSDKIKSSKFAKIVVAGTLAGIVALSGSVMLNNIQHENFESSTKIVETIDLPNQIYNDVDLATRANGDSVFINDEGTTFSEYNGMNANQVAQTYSGRSI